MVKKISLQTSVVFYEFKSWLLIIKSDTYNLSYHRNFSMVFKATITMEWNSRGLPSCSMVFGSPSHRVLMVFYGCPPSVKRCDGHMPSPKSSRIPKIQSKISKCPQIRGTLPFRSKKNMRYRKTRCLQPCLS